MNARGHFVHKSRSQAETSSAYTKWTAKEEAQLIELIRDGKMLDEIATTHKRTTGAIRARLVDIAVSIIQSDKSIKKEPPISAQQHPKSFEASEETELEVLKEIRDSILRIEARLQ